MSQPNYQDYWDELAQGRCYGIFVDDTGSPGLQDTPPNLHPERKTWVAVVVTPDLMPKVLEQIPQAITELQRITGATEFHFSDIYNKRGPFKTVDLQARLAIFEFMAHVFSVYRFPVLVQTFDPVTLSNIRERSATLLQDRLIPFDLTKPEDTALLSLLIRLRWFMEKTATYPTVKARVFIDEGFMKNGIAIKIPTFGAVFAGSLICFAQSKSILPLQLADFAAFALNRVQLIGGKEQRSSLDNRLLQILSPIAWNYQNLEHRVFSLATEGPIFKAHGRSHDAGD